jgi:hypothetical protein
MTGRLTMLALSYYFFQEIGQTVSAVFTEIAGLLS